MNDTTKKILTQRGLATEEEQTEYLSKTPKLTHDPFLLPDMEAGADFVYDIIESGAAVCIYGDYDCDGIMASAILCSFIKRLGNPNVSYYIPSRFEEGYGLNKSALEAIAKSGFEAVITVDCGSVSAREVAYAQEDLGLEILVTDHHECPKDLLPDCPVINPKREDSAYPFQGLCGAGVAFKLAQAVKDRYYEGDKEVKKYMNSLLDLVAVATVADVMPLTDENRTLVKYGLGMLRAARRPAFAGLCKKISIDPATMTAHNIAFGIAPHLNAAGRLATADAACELFLTEDEQRMNTIIDSLAEMNAERKRVQDAAVEECKRICEEKYIMEGKPLNFMLVRPREINEGVSGIVAGKLRETYSRPAAVLAKESTPRHCEERSDEAIQSITNNEDRHELKGSARSTKNVDLITLLRTHANLFTKLGGHAMAAGFTLPEENEDKLRQALCEDLGRMEKENPEIFKDAPTPEAEITAEEASIELAAELAQFEPTGAGNPKPLLELTPKTIANPKRMGAEGKHLSFTADGIRSVWFNAPTDAEELLAIKDVKLLGTLETNTWNNNTTVQFKVINHAAPEAA
jgi:single-stranded-DNA-specific exonuclease